ncbi:MAG: hypothetical protein SFY81_04950 [Verrucomicrobiota bacterium]|nr:hypothetical protein [Verrucomicrobiota bacterium]
MKLTIDQIIAKYGIENPSAMAESGCSAAEYNAAVARNSERVRKMSDEEYRVYIAPRNEQILEDLVEAEEAQARDTISGEELIQNHDMRRVDESPRG